jgi:hypothetical protein
MDPEGLKIQTSTLHGIESQQDDAGCVTAFRSTQEARMPRVINEADRLAQDLGQDILVVGFSFGAEALFCLVILQS